MTDWYIINANTCKRKEKDDDDAGCHTFKNGWTHIFCKSYCLNELFVLCEEGGALSNTWSWFGHFIVKINKNPFPTQKLKNKYYMPNRSSKKITYKPNLVEYVKYDKYLKNAYREWTNTLNMLLK